MLTLSRRFKKNGYRVVNFPYSQMTKPLDEITARLIESVQNNAAGRKFHLIGHSLGNIIIRTGFKKGYPPGLGRIVMLAPPNRPAKLAKKFKNNLLYRWIMGDSGQKLSEQEFYDTLPVPDVEFGVIAGDKGDWIVGNRALFARTNIDAMDSYPLYGMATIDNPALQAVASRDFLAETCVRPRIGLFALVSRIAPTGGDNFEDLAVLDATDPHQWLLVVAVEQEGNLLIYRKLYTQGRP